MMDGGVLDRLCRKLYRVAQRGNKPLLDKRLEFDIHIKFAHGVIL